MVKGTGHIIDFVTQAQGERKVEIYWAKRRWVEEKIGLHGVLYIANAPDARARLCWDRDDVLVDDNPENLAVWPGLRVVYAQPYNAGAAGEIGRLDQLLPEWGDIKAVIGDILERRQDV